uniref:Uncharacterized protein n=1 Tax=Ditylum brightwellii TaxID=49249 RepID=A0A7S1Z6I9_9STRA|mmetsp:Transcript_25557/g.38015  ORF Transcript_25557/g.38015 Transcript_25557/m.38015 type:complete len:184 (+) Transcript_25557:138-689(+)
MGFSWAFKLFFFLCLLILSATAAAFGLGDKAKSDLMKEAGIDLDDPELLAAMEIFLDMSPEEMEDVMKDLTLVLGDDPETLSAMEEVVKELSTMKIFDLESTLEGIITDEHVAAATHNALEAIGKAEWTTIWSNQELILEAVIQSGQISPEDAATFKTDEKAWENELKVIWNELQKEAQKQEL